MVPNPDVFALTLGLSYNLLAIAEEEDRLTVVVGGANRYFRIGLIVGILAILADFLLELALLRQLSVFNTGLGLWVSAYPDDSHLKGQECIGKIRSECLL